MEESARLATRIEEQGLKSPFGLHLIPKEAKGEGEPDMKKGRTVKGQALVGARFMFTTNQLSCILGGVEADISSSP